MLILVVNAGSSSLKYQILNMTNEDVLAKGICERIGSEGSCIEYTNGNAKKVKELVPLANHTDAFHEVVRVLTMGDHPVIKDMKDISAVGHRIVQGGAIFKHSTLVNDKVIEDIDSLCDLAPLHNHAHIQGIKACIDVLGKDVPEVVVFDTSFHQTMPQKAFMFAIPYKYYEKYQIRRYGFHGTSHRYVSAKCAEVMGKDIKDLKIITCHLGNGSSLAAVDHGKCVDTTMGLTPLDGFMMGTRCGTLDPSVVTYIAEKEHLTPSQLSDLFNKQSGMLGVSGISSDNRDIEDAAAQGNERAILCQEMLAYQVSKFIGAFTAAMNGVDAIVFTGGIGENGAILREDICKYLGYLGVTFNTEINDVTKKGKFAELSNPDSKVKVYCIPTNEELVIARDTKELVENLNK